MDDDSLAKQYSSMQNNNQVNNRKYVFAQETEHENGLKQIMSSIHNQEKQILSILDKYKDTIPNQSKNMYDVQVKKQIKKYENLAKSTIVKDSQQMQYSEKGSRKVTNKALSLNKRRIKSSKKEQSQFGKLSNDIQQVFKLPKVKRKNQVVKKQQHQIYHDKVNKQYQYNMQKLFESIKSQNNLQANAGPLKIRKNEQKQPVKKYKNDELYHIYDQKQDSLRSKKSQINKQIAINIMNYNQKQGQTKINNRRGQISEPISYNPYLLNQMKDSNITINSRDREAVQNNSNEKSMPVSMTFYIQNFNEKLRQQCKEQINYLYFSRADEDGTNKIWAQQVLKLFEKHDLQLQKNHKSMRYLQTFDESYFNSFIYKGNQYK